MATTFLPGATVKGYKIIGRPLSKGVNANAYKAQNAAGEYVFLKQYKSPSVKVGWYKKYINYQKEIKTRIESSPAVSNQTYRFLDFFEFEESPKLFCYCQAFEFVSGGCDLAEHLRNPKITWNQRLTFAKLLMMGIRSLHSVKIVHSDLKPENLYLIPDAEIKTGYRFKVIDFDVSLLSDVTAPWNGIQGYAGTPGYLSPEHLNSGEIPNETSDVFTCGIILCELLCKGGNPYSYEDEDEYKEQVLGHRVPPLSLLDTTGNPNTDIQIEEIIFASLSPDPVNRPSVAEIHEVLKGKITTSGGRKVRPVPTNCCLILEAPNKTQVKFNITTEVGRSILSSFGEDIRFLSSPQFILSKEEDSWLISPVKETCNATILNGALLTEPTRLNLNDEITVGNIEKEIFKMPIRVLWEKK
jgi:serine/threonine protein kinase